jgi:hypothetical protein
VASLQSELSEGGLDTGEQIEVLKEMKNYAEPGSQDMLDIESKIGLMEETKRKEDRAIEMNKRVSDLYDKFAPGDISTEEALIINREMQKYVEKGTEEYIALKEAEAKLLGASGESGAAKESKEIEAQLDAQQTQLSLLADKFARGEINASQYLEGQEATYAMFLPQDVSAGMQAKIGPAGMAEWKGGISEFENTKAAVKQGQMAQVLVQEGENMKSKLVPLSELTKDIYASEMNVPVYDTEENAVKGKEGTSANIIRVFDKSGKLRAVVRGADNQLYEVTEGSRMVEDPVTGNDVKEKYYVKGQVLGLMDIVGQSKSEEAAGVKRVAEEAERVKNQPSAGFTTDITTRAKEAAKEEKTKEKIKKTATSVAKAVITPSNVVGSIVSKLPAGKVSGTKDLGISEIAAKVLGVKPTGPGKVNVPLPGGNKVNIPEYGINPVQKVTSLFKSATSKVKNWWDKLFGK